MKPKSKRAKSVLAWGFKWIDGTLHQKSMPTLQKAKDQWQYPLAEKTGKIVRVKIVEVANARK